MSAFDESRSRLKRAKTHAETFVDLCRSFLNNESYRHVHEMRDARNGVLKVVHVTPPDPDIPLLIGEYFYQLRSALDAAMWQAYVLLGGPQDATNAKKVYFPIREASPKKGPVSPAFELVQFPNELRDWIEAVQPYSTNKLPDRPDVDILRLALDIINDRSTKDRHRRLNVIGAEIAENTVLVYVTPPAEVTYVHTEPANIFEDGAVYASFGLANADHTTKIKAQGGFSVQISIEEVAAAPGVSIESQLQFLIRSVDVIIREFETAFGE